MNYNIESNRGIALFIVLWILALLSVIAGEFCHAMRTGMFMTRNFKDETQAYYIAKAGLNLAISDLIKNKTMTEKKSQWRINSDILSIPFAQGNFKIHINNESGKININRASETLLKIMLNHYELDDNEKNVIVDSILDWRDEDNLNRLNGAESKYYNSLSKPYDAKNGDFDSIEELLLIRGMTPDIFYNGIKEIVTVYPRPEMTQRKKIFGGNIGTDHFDYNKININAASIYMLRSLPLMNEDSILAVINYRKIEDFKSIPQLIPVVGIEIFDAISPYLTLEFSPVYTVQSVGTVSDGQTKSGLQAVLKMDSGIKRKYRIIQQLDKLQYMR